MAGVDGRDVDGSSYSHWHRHRRRSPARRRHPGRRQPRRLHRADARFLIVFGGTAGVMIASSGLKAFLQMPKLFLVSHDVQGRDDRQGRGDQDDRRHGREGAARGPARARGGDADADRPLPAEGHLRWSSTAPTPSSSRTSSSPTWTPMEARHAEQGGLFADGGRLRADPRHHRHRHGPRARAREPLRSRHARPGDLERVHRDLLRRLLGEPRLLPDREQAQADLARRGARPHDDHRGHRSRSRPATTRASSRRSSRRSSTRPSARRSTGEQGEPASNELRQAA